MFADTQPPVGAIPYLLAAAEKYVSVPREVVENLKLGLRAIGMVAFALTRPSGLTHLAAVADRGALSREEEDFRLALLQRAAHDSEGSLDTSLWELNEFGGLPLSWAEPRHTVPVPADAAADSRVGLRAIGLLVYAHAMPDGTATIAKIVSGQPDPGDDDIARRAVRDLHEMEGPESIRHAVRELLDSGYLRSRLPDSGASRG